MQIDQGRKRKVLLPGKKVSHNHTTGIPALISPWGKVKKNTMPGLSSTTFF
jgi:hypothetical protein